MASAYDAVYQDEDGNPLPADEQLALARCISEQGEEAGFSSAIVADARLRVIRAHNPRTDDEREPMRIYFSVPSHYGIGPEFTDVRSAVEAARATIQPLDFGFSRAFVDMRQVSRDERGETDKVIRRWEVFPVGTKRIEVAA